jgi:Ca-activated chloride channel family protein
MRPHTLAAALVAIASAVCARHAAPQTAPQPPALFRAGADIVGVDASVQQDRRPLTGLKPADFELFDNGVRQEITDVTYEKLPIDVTVLLDVSASVTGGTLEELRSAVRQVRTDLAPEDRLRLIVFNMGIRRLVDFDDPPANVERALASAQGEGSSAVFDAVAVALTAAEAPGRRRLVILFSDGQDSSSISDVETLLDIAKRSTPTLAVILGSSSVEGPASLFRATRAAAPETVGALYERLAGETGGMVAVVKPGENLTSRFRRMVQDFRSSYVLYFTPKGVERAGVHTLDVRVKRNGAEVRARRSYAW